MRIDPRWPVAGGVIALFLSVASADLIWQEDFEDNFFEDTLNGECGNGQGPPCCGTGISLFIVNHTKRTGQWGAVSRLKKCHERAEFREKTRNQPSVGDSRWYGFSLRPDAGFDAYAPINLCMQLAQWYGGMPNWAQGAWHRLAIKDGRWIYTYKYSEDGQTGSAGVRETSVDLGAVTLNRWTDFVINGDWKRSDQGVIQVWIRQPGGNYVKKVYKKGWVMMNIDRAPYLKLGLYRGDPDWEGKDDEDRLYIDSIKVGDTWFGEVTP